MNARAASTDVAPASWEQTYLGHLVQVRSGCTPSKDNPRFWNGNVPWVSPKDMKVFRIADSEDHLSENALVEGRIQRVPLDSVLIVTRGMILDHTVPVALTTAPVTINQDMKALLPRGRIHAHFLAWLLTGLNEALLARVEEAGHGTKALRTDLWKKLPVAIPSLKTQVRIAASLDRKTAAIDDLIQKKELLVELLQEKRQALITHAVTKGLDSNAPMRDSGVRWIDRIPNGWTRTKLRRVCTSIRDGTHTPPPRVDGIHRLLSARNIVDGEFVFLDDDRTMTPEAFVELERSYTVRLGDVVITTVGATTGKSAVVRSHMPNASVQRSVAVLRATRSVVEPEYLNLWITSSALQAIIAETASKYAAQPGIYLDELAALPVLVPPLDEQRRILSRMWPQFAAISSVTGAARHQLQLLGEYRQALISAAVTGQLDLAAAMADEVPAALEKTAGQ